MLVNLVTDIHKSTQRDYLSRMTADKPLDMAVARCFGKDFFDGDRKYGYGGYQYDGRWLTVAKKLTKWYELNKNSKVLDIGCGKGFLAKDIKDISKATVTGCDISHYALKHCEVDNFRFNAGVDELEHNYDLIISINTLHNLLLPNLKQAIKQIVKHSIDSYIVVESYRNVTELHNLQCWALTCEQFFRPSEWEFIFNECGYKGDFEFIFFE